MNDDNYWTRIFRRRMTRRSLLGAGAAAAAGAAAISLVGCEDGGTAPRRSPGASGEPIPGGVLKQGRSIGVLGLDPHTDIFGLDIVAQMYSFLYSLGSSTGAAPDRPEEVVLNSLATKFERPDPEHLEYIFTIRPGVKYHPKEPVAGLEVTAEDVRASFHRRSTALTAIDKRFPGVIDFAKSEVLPGNVFKLVTTQPFVPAIPEMANPTWGVVSTTALDQFTSLSTREFGSGPFMLDAFIGSERISLARHPEFFVPDRPLLDGREWIVIQDNSSLLTAFKSGQHDVSGAVLDKRTAEDLQKNANIVVNKFPNLFYPVINFRVSRPPFNDIRVREAVDLAINRDEIIERIQQGEGVYNGPIQWGQERWALPQEELRQLLPYDPDLAKDKLKEAGYDQLNVTVPIPELPGPQIVGDYALLLREQLKRANINIELDSVELGSYLTTVLLQGNFDMTFFIHLPYGEPDRPLSFYHSKGVTGQSNWTGLNRSLPAAQEAGFSPKVDELIEAQQREFDPVKRKKIILDVQRRIIREHGPQITITGSYAYTAFWDYVKLAGQPGVGGPSIFSWDIWLDKA
ncbi:MAG: ABC transporter substrate-binding protein [Chloroflexi bacterium]|nr:ABC transporter substrate-binding protein [Chloroflexota bacterium]